MFLRIPSGCAIITDNTVVCWNRPWQYGCNRPNALPSGRAFFVYRHGGGEKHVDWTFFFHQLAVGVNINETCFYVSDDPGEREHYLG